MAWCLTGHRDKFTSTKATSFSMTTFSASLTNHTALLPQSRDSSRYVSRPILAPPLLWLQKHTDYAHTTSRTVPTCDVSVGSLTLPASEAGGFVELIPLYTSQPWTHNHVWSAPLPYLVTLLRQRVHYKVWQPLATMQCHNPEDCCMSLRYSALVIT
jgi:hypothetical protein